MKCRHCDAPLSVTLANLGECPPSNAYLSSSNDFLEERSFPLKVMVCSNCRLAQTVDYVDHKQLFVDDYAYLSSFSASWLAHAEKYVENMVSRFQLGPESMVVEIAANDGYLLQYVKQRGIPCLGIEPTRLAAEEARKKSIDIVEEFFGVPLATTLVAQGKQADLMAANNVLAHVPDINDIASGFSLLLKPGGVGTFEFPHLMNLLEESQFDTIYHEHFSYLSLYSVDIIFRKNGLEVFDVEQIPTHGGSLRVFAQRLDSRPHPVSPQVHSVIEQERAAGMMDDQVYIDFAKKVQNIKNDLLSFLIDQNKNGKKVVAYGAAAKGNTLMNYAGVRTDYVSYVVDKNPAKKGKYMPGNHLPIVDEEKLREDRPDYVLILPWNLKSEIMKQLAYIKEWGGKFVAAIPDLQVMS